MKQEILKNAYYGLGIARSFNFTAQSVLLPLIDKLLGGGRERSFKQFEHHLRLAYPKIQKLLRTDAENIAKGYYPSDVMFAESPFEHYTRIPFLIGDAVRANRQRQSKKTANFENEELEFVEQSPEYYRRNFHFQKSGYLGDESAKLYDHQVEILFSGTAQVMRRQMIPELKKHFSNSDGEGLKFLEVGSGTGSLTRAMALAFPKAQITCLDLSPHYLKFAQKRLENFKRISYVLGKGEALDFKDETFDAVFSCYLFHELPKEIRTEVLIEKNRVLKKGGILAVAESIQRNDDPELDWALSQFPLDFHEPFYKNYIENNLEQSMKELFKTASKFKIHFLTKFVFAIKS